MRVHFVLQYIQGRKAIDSGGFMFYNIMKRTGLTDKESTRNV